MYKQISHNKRNTAFLLTMFIGIFMGLGYFFGYFLGEGDPDAAIGSLGIFGIIAIVYAAISYYAAGKLTLKIAHAKEIQKKDHFELFTTVENLCITSGLPTPKIYIFDATIVFSGRS